MLLSVDLATVHSQWEGCNVTNSVHIRIAGLQLRVHLHTVQLCLQRVHRCAVYPEQAPMVIKGTQTSMVYCLRVQHEHTSNAMDRNATVYNAICCHVQWVMRS